jgi:hypothetical protein
MSWKKTDLVLKKRFNQHALGDLITAGQVCRQAEILLPDLFTAVSFRRGVLHLRLEMKHSLQFKLVQGKLMIDLNHYCETHHLPKVERFKLTFSQETASI